MCLQWCHVLHSVIDNDHPCTWCTHFSPGPPAADRTCADCAHRTQRVGQQPFCALSKSPLPSRQSCCHWNVVPDAGPLLLLSNEDVAPEVLQLWGVETLAALFAHSESAPVHTLAPDGRVQVALADLALPLVYGVPVTEWESALTEGADQQQAEEHVVAPPRVVEALIALLDTLAERYMSSTKQEAARQMLRTTLACELAGKRLPEPWPTLIAEALAIE